MLHLIVQIAPYPRAVRIVVLQRLGRLEAKEAAERYEKHNQMDKFHSMAENFLGFMMDNFNTEMVIYGARLALKNYGLPFDHKKLKNFGKFLERFGKLIIDA